MARKPRRRPNGAGTIITLSGFRTKPFAVRITLDEYTEKGYQKQKILDTFETYEEAYVFLEKYNTNKRENIISEVDEKKLNNIPTFRDIYYILHEEEFRYLRNKGSGYKSWFKYFEVIHKKTINEVTLKDLQQCIDKYNYLSYGSLAHAKILATKIFEYAIINKYIKKTDDYSCYIKLNNKNAKKAEPPKIRTGRRTKSEQPPKPFTIDEIKALIADNTEVSKSVLIMILTGLRPIEYLTLKKDNVFLDESINGEIVSYMIGGSKTEAGRNRIIPIHRLIKPYIEEKLSNNDKWLGCNSKKSATHNFRINHFVPLMNRLKMNHVPYDTRHTFSTLAEAFELDNFVLKKIFGHKFNDLTKDNYTHTNIVKAFKEVQKIVIE